MLADNVLMTYHLLAAATINRPYGIVIVLL